MEKRLAIEIDGGQHAEQTAHDKQRSKNLEAAGFRVVRFWNNDVLTNTDGVVESVLDTLDKPTPVPPHPNPLPDREREQT